MWYKEAKPSDTSLKNSSENDKRHFRYRLFKFPIFFIQREIIGDGQKFKFSLTSVDRNFELNNVGFYLQTFVEDIYEKWNDICFIQSELWLEMLFLIKGS